MIGIEVPKSDNSLVSLTLDEKYYQIKFDYNFHGDYWTYGLIDSSGNYLYRGVKIVPCVPLDPFGIFKDTPNGIFIADTALDRIGRNDFSNGNARFCFIPSVERMEDIVR